MTTQRNVHTQAIQWELPLLDGSVSAGNAGDGSTRTREGLWTAMISWSGPGGRGRKRLEYFFNLYFFCNLKFKNVTRPGGAYRRLRQEDCCELKPGLNYIVRLYLKTTTKIKSIRQELTFF